MPEATKLPPVTFSVSMFTVPVTVPPLVDSLLAESEVKFAIRLRLAWDHPGILWGLSALAILQRLRILRVLRLLVSLVSLVHLGLLQRRLCLSVLWGL